MIKIPPRLPLKLKSRREAGESFQGRAVENSG